MAQSVPHIPPPRPGDAIAWGSTDYATNTLPMWTPDGHWFTIDLATVKEIADPTIPELTEEEVLARAHTLADEADTVAKCYFIGGDEGPIKIGYSIDVAQRLRAIQLCSPIKLRVLAVASGGAERESAYHWQFDEHRSHGEWFNRVPAILAEIERLAPHRAVFVPAREAQSV